MQIGCAGAGPTPRPQFHHVIDVVPTIYEITKITPPRIVNGVEQDSFDGVSMAYTFADAKAKGRRTTQFFDVMASRGIYHDGWYASTFGPRTPWLPGMPKGINEWSPENDVWELYNLEEDWSQASNLAAEHPEKLEFMKDLFLVESTKNENLPIGGGLYSMIIDPTALPSTPYTEWTFNGVTRMPEVTAPKLGKLPNLVTMEVDVPDNANGVLYSLGGFSGGLTCYLKDGFLNYEFNLFMIDRTRIRSKEKLPIGKVKLEVETRLPGGKIGGPLDVTIRANGKEVAAGKVPISITLGFTVYDALDFGSDLGSPVSNDYYDQAPFKFNGTIGTTTIKYLN